MLNMQLKNTVKCFFVFVIIYWKTNRIPEDAVQETFLKYMVKAPLFKDSDHEKAWLIKVATNISKNISRYNNRHAAENLDELREIGIRDNDRDIFEL